MFETLDGMIYIGEATRLLDASRSTVLRMIERGELDCLRVLRGQRQFRVFWRSQVVELALARSPRPEEAKAPEPVAAGPEHSG